MQEHYAIDLAEPGLLDRRSARWLQSRLRGLVNRQQSPLSPGTRIQRALFPQEEV